MTSRTPRTIEKWTSHIYGAAALLELRGAEQLQDEDGLKLFVQLRFQIVCDLTYHCPSALHYSLTRLRSPVVFKEAHMYPGRSLNAPKSPCTSGPR